MFKDHRQQQQDIKKNIESISEMSYLLTTLATLPLSKEYEPHLIVHEIERIL